MVYRRYSLIIIIITIIIIIIIIVYYLYAYFLFYLSIIYCNIIVKLLTQYLILSSYHVFVLN